MSRRHLLAFPLVGGVTLGLAMIMQAVIASEFVPQPTVSFRASLNAYILEPQMIIYGEIRGQNSEVFLK